MNKEKHFIDSDQVIRRLGISRLSLYRYVKEGKLKPLPRGGTLEKLRFRKDDFEELLKNPRLKHKGGFQTGPKPKEEART